MKMNEEKKDGLALRKLRELKKMSRKEACIVLGVNYKTIEKFENGRTKLLKKRIEKIIFAYGFKLEDFSLCRQGHINKVKAKLGYKKVRVLDDNKTRRSYQRVITKEVKTLTAMRRLKGFSQYQASFLCGYSRSTIGHIENGRIELSKEGIAHIMSSYGFSLKEYDHYFKSERLITDIQDECIQIIKGFSEEKLKTVQLLLITLNN